GNAFDGLVNTVWYPASVVQSATVASQVEIANDRRAVNLFCGPGSASPAIAGRSSALTLTVVIVCGVPPASAIVTCFPATPLSDAQSVASVSSAIWVRFTPSPLTTAPAFVDARLCGRFSRNSWVRPGWNTVVNLREPNPAPVTVKVNGVLGRIWNVSGM